MPAEVVNAVMEFTRAYHDAIEIALEDKGRGRFAHHGEATKVLAIMVASDGIAAFYYPPPPPDRPAARSGCYTIDFREYDLNTVCQTLSNHHLRVAPPNLGKPWDAIDPIPPETELIPETTNFFHPDVSRAVLAGQLTRLPGMTIGTPVLLENGIRNRVAPGRVKIWSPTFDCPGVGRIREFVWTHADFWWTPDELDLNPEQAPDFAYRDLLALEILLSHTPQLTPELSQKNAGMSAADMLDRDCDEFISMLEADGDDEERIHQWLKRKEHWLFLDPDHKEVRSKVPLVKHKTDFVIRRSDDTYVLVEIERASLRIFKKSDSDPTAEFNHACTQVRDWKRFINDNVSTVRNEMNLPGIYDPHGMIVMGRSRDIQGEQALSRWRYMKNSYDVSIYTYDELCDRVRAVAISLRNILNRTG
jgi:Domain of unknown function (DUF4263)